MLKEISIVVILAKAEKIAQHILPLGAAKIYMDTKSVFPIKRVVKVNQGGKISFDVHYLSSNIHAHVININELNAKHYDFTADFTKANPQSTRNPDRFTVHPWTA